MWRVWGKRKLKGKTPLGKHKCRKDDITKMDIKK
jgi:hypothetical protein